MADRAKILQLMEEALDSNEYDKFIQYEMIHYLKYIKTTEEKKHYEKCLSEIEQMSKRYGQILKKTVAKYDGKPSNSICYFLPSIDNDLAHIEILSHILAQHKPSNYRITVAGYSSQTDGCESKLLTSLEKSRKIDLMPLEQTHKSIVSFVSWLNREKVNQLIVMSIPTLIPAFINAMGSSRVTWFSSKFELECFTSLKNRISCCGHEYETKKIGNSTWNRMPAALDAANILEFQARKITDGSCRLVSINREEKIKNENFLKCVTEILKKNPKATFYWTGRTEEPTIQSFFKNHGIAERCHYIGWVDPKAILHNFDIFLDTPSLSGTVAATAFAAGIPVLTFRNSQSWIEFFKPKLQTNLADKESRNVSFPLIAENNEDYIEIVTSLINDSHLYKQVHEYQKIAGAAHFFDKKKLYNSHLNYIKKVTNMEFT